MTYYAHLSADGRQQTVDDHLRNTAAMCGTFASSFCRKEAGEFIGLMHDIGKCSDAFQKRLRGGSVVDHSTAGALECAKQDALWAACCVAGHHSGMPDVGSLKNDMAGEPTLYGRLRKAIRGDIPSYEVPFSIQTVPHPDPYGQDPLTDSYLIRMLYSCLVDADYLDTEQFMATEQITRGQGDSLSSLLLQLNRYIEPWFPPKNDLNRMRCEILQSCMDAGAAPRGLYTLTVPTGGGKTISSMAFALHHGVKHHMDRVIYVIPYTSIIEQTADVFRGIFGEKNVVEHHSNANLDIREDGPESQYGNARAVENWDAPIIVTTAVQFFESMYANRPSKCRKLHSIANSVIIFDEAQMLPAAQLRPCAAAIAKLVERFRATAVLCTATQPVLNDLFREYAPAYKPREICHDIPKMFERFRRVRFEHIGSIDADGLADRLSQMPQVLCIVNSRKSAQAIYGKIPSEGSYHLSTLMVPWHRLQVLAEIRERLGNGLPCRVISTSLIEAGVDVDFPAVYRELAGLDSILQAAGRCNRENRRPAEDSVVTVFEGVSTPPLMLKVNIGATRETLGSGADLADPETISRYFRAYRSLASDKMDQAGIIDALSRKSGRVLPFKTVAERFHLIEDNAHTVYIPIGDGASLVQRLRSGERSRTLFRQLGRYGVNVYDNTFEILKAQGALELLDDDSAVLTDVSLYHKTMGLVVSDKASDCLFI